MMTKLSVKKIFVQKKKNPKHTNIWSWDETPELRAFIKKQENGSTSN